MFRLLVLSIALALPVVVQAADLLLSDLRARHAVELSADDLRQLMPNARVASVHENGSVRHWKNEPNGKFLASSNVRGKLKTLPSQGRGTWRVSDDGTYCVTIEWPRLTENWCKYLFKLDGKYYGVDSVANPHAKALDFEFSP
jgi:hypothetical protein